MGIRNPKGVGIVKLIKALFVSAIVAAASMLGLITTVPTASAAGCSPTYQWAQADGVGPHGYPVTSPVVTIGVYAGDQGAEWTVDSSHYRFVCALIDIQGQGIKEYLPPYGGTGILDGETVLTVGVDTQPISAVAPTAPVLPAKPTPRPTHSVLPVLPRKVLAPTKRAIPIPGKTAPAVTLTPVAMPTIKPTSPTTPGASLPTASTSATPTPRASARQTQPPITTSAPAAPPNHVTAARNHPPNMRLRDSIIALLACTVVILILLMLRRRRHREIERAIDLPSSQR